MAPQPVEVRERVRPAGSREGEDGPPAARGRRVETSFRRPAVISGVGAAESSPVRLLPLTCVAFPRRKWGLGRPRWNSGGREINT